MENRTASVIHKGRVPLVPTGTAKNPPSESATATKSVALPFPDVVCLSHLRWDFVFQRPQHLLTRFARNARVFYIEEPELRPGPASLTVTLRENGVHVVVPRLPEGLSPEEQALL